MNEQNPNPETDTPTTAKPAEYDEGIKMATKLILTHLAGLPAPVVMDVLTSCLMTAASMLNIPGAMLRTTVSQMITEAFGLSPERPADLTPDNLSALLRALGKDDKPTKHTIGFCGTTAQKL